MKTAIVGDLYGIDIASYIIRYLAKKYDLYCVNTKESNLQYDKVIHEKEIKLKEADHLIITTSLEEAFYVPNKKLSYLLVGYNSKIDLLKLNGFNNILTFNQQVYSRLIELGLNTAVLLNSPNILSKREVKKIHGPKNFIIGFTEYNPEVLYTILNELDRDLSYGFLVPTINSTLISYDITDIKSKTHNLAPIYIYNIKYSSHSISRIFKSSHLVLDTSGFFRNIQVDKAYYYKSSITDFYANFQEVYRQYYKNKLTKILEDYSLKSIDLQEIL